MLSVLEAIRSLSGVQQEALIVGDSGSGERAERLGLACPRVSLPAGSLRLGARAIAGYARRLPRGSLVHCWGRALGERLAGILGPASIVLFTDLQTGGVFSRGLEVTRLGVGVRRTGADGATALRAARRAELGIAADEPVLALIDDPPGNACALAAVSLCGVLRVAGVHATLLADARGGDAPSAAAAIGATASARRTILVDAPAAWYAPAADAALSGMTTHAISGTLPWSSRLTAAMAAANGVPTFRPRARGEADAPWLSPTQRPTDFARRLAPLLALPPSQRDEFIEPASGSGAGIAECLAGAWRAARAAPAPSAAPLH